MNLHRRLIVFAGSRLAAATAAVALGSSAACVTVTQAPAQPPDQVLEWNQIFIDTLVATNTANSSSQRLGAIVHTAVFDAYNGIERRYAPIFVQNVDGNGERMVPPGASRRAAVIAAAYTALVGAVPLTGGTAGWTATPLRSRRSATTEETADSHGSAGIAWGTQVAQAVLAWRAADGFSASYPPFIGGTAVGQWRPIAPASSMSAQGLAFTVPLASSPEQHAVPAGPSANARERHIRGGLQRRQGTRSPDRFDAY